MRYFGKILLVSLGASLLLWALESVYTLSSGAGLAKSPGGAVFFILLLLLLFIGWGIVAGIAQSIWLSVIGAVYRRAERRRGRVYALALTAAVASMTLAPYVACFSCHLFSGEGISKSPYILYLRVGFPLFGIIVVYLFACIVISNLRNWFLPSRRAARAVATTLAALLLVWIYSANARLFVGQYGFIHQAVSLVMFVLAELVALNLLGERRLSKPRMGAGAGAGVAAACVLLAGGAVAGRLGCVNPGSGQLSLLYSRAHLGKQLIWIYGFGEVKQRVDASSHREYLAERDDFLRGAPGIKREGHNFIWIMVDALRADHLPMYGYKRNTSPSMKKLADRSLLFLHNYTQGPNTGTSLAAQMTGCYTSTIRARGGIKNVDTVAEILKRKGYQTWAVAQQWDINALKEKGKEGVGFDRIIVAGHIPAPEINEKAIKLLEERDADRPFFLFAFYYEPHDPYVKHAEFDYGDRAIDLYDSEISYLDRCFSQLFGYLGRNGYGENTILLVTADHGDEIGQHGGWGHHWKLHDCLIHVPFILYVPGVDPAVISSPIHSIDMAASLIEMLDLQTESTLDGSSFIPCITKGEPSFTPMIFSEAEFQSSNKVCLNQYPWKLVYHMSDSYFDLFNLEADPGETVNRIGENPEMATALKNRLLSWLSYRDRSSRAEGGEIEDAKVKEIRKKLDRHDPAALDGLAALGGMKISEGDFRALEDAVKPYFSSSVAVFLITQARENPAVRPAALEELAAVVKRADEILGGSDEVVGETFGTVQYDEAKRILACLSDEGRPRFLLSIASGSDRKTARTCLDMLGMIRDESCAEELYALYQEETDPEKKQNIFRALCMIGDPRVEDELLRMVEGQSDYNTVKPLLPLFANYRTEGSREFLLRVAGYGGWYLQPVTIAIGRTENEFMLPVLKKIFSAGGASGDVSHSAATFSKKMAILSYIRIKGRDNLSAADRKAIKEAYEGDVSLAQFRKIRQLCESL